MPKIKTEGFPSRPWKVGPLKGKYYGTVIQDAFGGSITEIWIPHGAPSMREQMDPEDICDSHYESDLTYRVCCAIVNAVNGLDDV